jgi:drug/metabolite transporter (DMT)-like permease
VWLLIVEAVAAGLVGVLLVYQGIAGEAADRGNAFALAGFAAVLAAALAGLGLALSRRKPRARAPAIVLQLLSVMIGLALATSGLGLAGLPVAVIGVTTATFLLTPSTHEALGVRSPSGGR